MEAARLFKSLDRNQRNTFLACFLGWARDAPGGRVHLWIAWRPFREAHPPDDQHHLLLSYGIAHGVFPELYLAAHLPRALRNRHGRRVGTWGVAGNGDASDCSARVVLRNLTAR